MYKFQQNCYSLKCAVAYVSSMEMEMENIWLQIQKFGNEWIPALWNSLAKKENFSVVASHSYLLLKLNQYK